MNKKNLLTLGALCLSLGLVVTSCGSTGAKGEDGKQGEKGDQGEKGADGKDGASPVVVLNNAGVITGGEISADKYNVFEGDKVTFTFKAADEKNGIIVEFEINGKEIAIDPTATSYTYTVEQVEAVQVTSAKFSTVSTYGPSLMDDYAKSINEKDPYVQVSVADSITKYAGADYVDSTKVNKALTDSKTAITTALGKLASTATVSEKVEAINKTVESEKAKLDKAYSDALSEAKTAAKKAVGALSDAIKSSNYSDTDRASILKGFEDKIDAATNFGEINAVVNDAAVTDSTTKATLVEVGEANKLYASKSSAFGLVETALSKVLESEPTLDSKSTGYDALVSSLATWGVEVSSLPSATAKTYLDQISAATELEVYASDSASGSELTYSKGQPVLGVEGAAAVTNTLSNLKKELIAAIKASYFAEIDGSTVLADAPNAKTTLKAVIEGLVTKYQYGTTYKLADIYGTTGTTLVTEIEKAIDTGTASQLPNTVIEAFSKERLVNASKSAKTALDAVVKSIKDSDAVYTAAIKGTLVSTGTYAGTYSGVASTIGNTGYTVPNPYFTIATDNKVNYGSPVANATTAAHGSYSVDIYEASLFDDSGALKDVRSVLEVKNQIVTETANLKGIYKEAKELYEDKQFAALNLGTSTDDETLKTEWNKLFADSSKYVMKDVSDARLAFATNSSLLFDDETGAKPAYLEYIDSKAGLTDSAYDEGTSSLDEKYKALQTSVLKGESGKTEVAAFIASFDDVYASDVASYKEKAISLFKDYVTNTLAGDTITVLQAGDVRTAETKALAALDEFYDSKTISGVDSWYKDAKVLVTKKATSDTTAGAGLLDNDTTTVSGLLAARKAQIADLTIGDLGISVKNIWKGLQSTFASVEAATSGDTSITFTEDTLVEMKVVLKETKLPSGKQLSTAGALSYDLTTEDGVNEYYKDVVALHDYFVAQCEAFVSATESSYALIASQLSSLIGFVTDDTNTEATLETNVASQLNDVLDKYFKASGVTTFDVTADVTVDATSKKVTAIAIKSDETAMITINSSKEVTLGDFAGTGFGLKVRSGKVSTYSILSADELESLISAIKTDCAKITGKASA